MSKASRNRRRLARHQAPVTRIVRNAEPGINMDDRTALDPPNLRQLVGFDIVATAVHSPTFGWIPGVMCTVTTVPLMSANDPDAPPEVLSYVLLGSDLANRVAVDILTTISRAEHDAAIGYRLE